MRVFLNALQAGNRSGTGAYAQALAGQLVGLLGTDCVRIAWNPGVARPGLPESALELSAVGPWGRLYYDQVVVPRRASSWGADLLHYPANVGALRSVTPFVLTIHDLSFLRNPGWFAVERAAYYRYAVRRTVRGAARIIAVSHAAADDIVELLGAPKELVDVIHNGVDERFRTVGDDRVAEVRARYELPERFFLYLGTLEPRKNLVRLIEAYDLIAATTPLGLVLAGREGWKCDALRRAVGASPNRARVHLPGYVAEEDVPPLMRAATVFVYPSLYEGFGIPVASAMAAGVPVVTSNVSSLPEITGDAALCVDPASVDAIATAMSRLSADALLRAELARRGVARSRQFTWRRAAERTIECYRRALRK